VHLVQCSAPKHPVRCGVTGCSHSELPVVLREAAACAAPGKERARSARRHMHKRAGSWGLGVTHIHSLRDSLVSRPPRYWYLSGPQPTMENCLCSALAGSAIQLANLFTVTPRSIHQVRTCEECQWGLLLLTASVATSRPRAGHAPASDAVVQHGAHESHHDIDHHRSQRHRLVIPVLRHLQHELRIFHSASACASTCDWCVHTRGAIRRRVLQPPQLNA
jgi:hypothetical protein